jgi:hypothetical protein
VFTRLTRTAAVTAIAASAIATAVAAAPAASASTTRMVCANDLYVRQTPQGVVIGTLLYGHHMRVDRYSPSGQYAYGYAYGQVNKYGWVQNGWFC